ncbi:hypothetical protein SAMN02990966_01174 [Rhodospirillales bacterium URHD0017]|nr:hypothetical protein SAMN02990966_01174 [Rhodospirillales bacterium URHD0017]
MKKTAAIALMACLSATPAGAQTERASEASKSQPTTVQSSSEKVRDNPAAQYVLVKTVVGQVMGVVDARAMAIEPEGYNLLKYCWTAENVLGDWAERAGLTGAMVVRALETRSWQRDLARAGYPEGPAAEAIGRYEAMLVRAGFTDAARSRAVDALVVDLDGLRLKTPGAAQVRAVHRCDGQRRSLALNYVTAPEDGRARFMPYVLHQICQVQQLNADDPIRCDYWMYGKTDKPMSFAGETVYSVRWLDGSTANGRFDPEQSRSAGTVTLRLRPPKATK